MSDKSASFESLIIDLTDALRENSDLLKGLTAKAKSSTAAAPSKSSKDDDDGEDEPAPKKTRASPGTKTTKAKAVTAKELKDASTEYLDVPDEDEYAERRAIVKKIVDKFGAEKMSELEEADRGPALELLKIAIAGDNPFPKKRSRDDDDV